MRSKIFQILCGALIVIALVLPIHQANAQFVGGVTILADIGQDVWDELMQLWNGLEFVAKKALISAVRDSLILWAQTGQWDNSSLLITNFKEFFLKQLDAEYAKFLSDAYDVELCSPFEITVETLLKFDKMNPRINSLDSATCTITEALRIQGYQLNDYYADFRNGSWDAWIEHNKPQNTPLGALAKARAEAAKRLAQRESGAESEAQSNKGYVGLKICVEPAADDSDICYREVIVSPGTLLADQLERFFGADLENFSNADTWDEIIYGLDDILMAKLFNSASDFFDGGLRFGGEGDEDGFSGNPATGANGGRGTPCDENPNICSEGLVCTQIPSSPTGRTGSYCQPFIEQGRACKVSFASGTNSGSSLGTCETGFECVADQQEFGSGTRTYTCDVPGTRTFGERCSLATLGVGPDLKCDTRQGLACDLDGHDRDCDNIGPSLLSTGCDEIEDLKDEKIGICKTSYGAACDSDFDCRTGLSCIQDVCQ